MSLVAGANVIRFTPSLVIPNEDIQQGLAQYEKAVAKIVNG
jgi:acetylornithine/N-succinyldiaminopimelate aminotransferase